MKARHWWGQTWSRINAPHLLLVDDTDATRLLLAIHLEHAGYRVTSVASGEEALDVIRRQGLPRLVLLDLALRESAAISLAQTIHLHGDVPILLLATVTDFLVEDGKFHEGFTDFLLKPVPIPELLEAVQQALFQAESAPVSDREVALMRNVSANFDQRYVRVGGRQVELTPIETRLLLQLYRHRGQVVSSGYLLRKAWARGREGTSGALMTHINRLRNKLKSHPDEADCLITVRGRGYSLRLDL